MRVRFSSPAMCARSSSLSTAIFGMGCFWAPQEVFQGTPGVESTRTGYASVAQPEQSTEAPSYFSVCQQTGSVGYTEAVEVTFDPSVVRYEDLMQVFWSNHDASQVTPGKEAQYRSVVWPTNDEQRALAAADVERAVGAYAAASMSPLGTVVAETTATTFVPAEGYHQNFWAKARLKLGALFLLLLLRAPGSPELALASGVGTQLVFFWWFVECFGLLAAASPFALLF